MQSKLAGTGSLTDKHEGFSIFLSLNVSQPFFRRFRSPVGNIWLLMLNYILTLNSASLPFDSETPENGGLFGQETTSVQLFKADLLLVELVCEYFPCHANYAVFFSFAPQAVNGQKQTSCRGRPLEPKSTGNFIGPFA